MPAWNDAASAFHFSARSVCFCSSFSKFINYLIKIKREYLASLSVYPLFCYSNNRRAELRAALVNIAGIGFARYTSPAL
jgi:hypothetical protein